MRTFKHKLINWLMEFVEMKWKQMESWNLLVLLNGPKRTRPHAIQQFNFDLISALPNGRNQSKWMLTADAAPSQTAIQDELRNCLGWLGEWARNQLIKLIDEGVSEPATKASKPNNNQSINSIKLIVDFVGVACLLGCPTNFIENEIECFLSLFGRQLSLFICWLWLPPSTANEFRYIDFINSASSFLVILLFFKRETSGGMNWIVFLSLISESKGKWRVGWMESCWANNP